jgi:RNA polymerase primary sigma factor
MFECETWTGCAEDDLLSMQASVLCALYEMRAVENAVGSHKELLKKDYQAFLEARTLLRDFKATGLPEEKVERVIREGGEIGTRTISPETPIGEGETQLLDFVKDEESASPEEACMLQNTAQEIEMILSTLSPREEAILRKRFGIGDDKTYTLEELGQEYGLTRERIRQIETKALLKLRHPCRSEKMRALAD